MTPGILKNDEKIYCGSSTDIISDIDDQLSSSSSTGKIVEVWLSVVIVEVRLSYHNEWMSNKNCCAQIQNN